MSIAERPRVAGRSGRGGRQVLVCRTPGPGKGTGGARGGLEHVGPAGTNRRARPRRCGIHPPLGPGRRRGGGIAAGVPRRVAQLLCGRRCFGGAVDSDAHLPRAVGTRGKRGNESRTSGDRKRRRGRRGRRVGADGRNGLGRGSRGPRGAGGGAAATRSRGHPARAHGRGAREDVGAYTHEAWAEGFSKALARRRAVRLAEVGRSTLVALASLGSGEVALGTLERSGRVNARGRQHACGPARVEAGHLDAAGSRSRGPARRSAVALALLALLGGAMPAQASEASQIIEKCATGQPIRRL